MQNFHDKEDLHSVALTQPLVQNIMKSLPLEVRPSFNDQFSKFRDQCPANVRPPATFLFLAKFVEKLEKNYRSTPYLYDLDLALSNIGVKVVRQGTSKPNPPPPNSSDPQRFRPPKPCAMCTIMGFEANHFSLSKHCGSGKLSSPEIFKLISNNNLCFTCTQAHGNSYKCKLTLTNGTSRVCTKGCLQHGVPVNRRACMHSNQAHFVTIPKVSANQSVPLVETLNLGGTKIGIQYDTGCQLSLISRSALSTIPQYMYSLGPSYKMKVLTYSGKARVILTTEVKLKLLGKTLRLAMIEDDLNNGSGFSLSIPHKWRSFTGTSTSQHTGQVEILLGGDNNLFFPSEIERDSQGMALYRSNLTQGYMVYGSVPSNIVTWVEPLDPSSNRARKFKRSNWQSGKQTPEKNQGNRDRTKRGTKNSRKLGGEAGETSISSRRNQEGNQEDWVKNRSNKKGNRREPRRLREKSGGQEEKQKENQTLKPNLNLTPTPASVRSDPTTTPITPTISPESQNNSITPVDSDIPGRDSGEKAGAGNLAPAPSSRPEPAQDEILTELNEINQ